MNQWEERMKAAGWSMGRTHYEWQHQDGRKFEYNSDIKQWQVFPVRGPARKISSSTERAFTYVLDPKNAKAIQ